MDSFENINGHGVITQLPSWEIVNNNVRTSLQNIELVVEDLDRQLCLLTNSYRFVSFNSTDINLLTSSFYFTLQAIDDISADGLNTIPARQELLKTTSSLLQQFGPKDFQTNMSNTIFNQLGMVVFALHETATSLLDCNQQIWAHNLHSLPRLRKKLESVLKIFDTVISTKNFTKDHNTLFEKMTMPNLPLNHSTRPINHPLSVLENLSKKFALSGKSSHQESSNGENPLKRKATTNIQSEVKKLKPSLPAIVSLDRTFSDEPVSESMSDEILYVPKPVVHSRKAILIDLSLEIGDGVPLSETPLPMDIQEEPNETVFDTELNVSHDLAVRALPDEFCHHLPIIDTRIAKILKGIPSLKMYKMLNASESNELDAIIVESQITGLPTCFVIGKISNDLGSGIFYTGTESLKKYKIVGLYSGVHQFRREGEDDTPTTDLAYTINITNSYFELSKKEHSTMYKKAKYNKNDQYAVVCSSKDKGNWTRLINHATDKFANIAYSLRKYNYLENDEHRSNYVILATVIRPILPGEQLLVNYGSSYWHGKNKPTPVAAKTFTYSNNGVQKM